MATTEPSPNSRVPAPSEAASEEADTSSDAKPSAEQWEGRKLAQEAERDCNEEEEEEEEDDSDEDDEDDEVFLVEQQKLLDELLRLRLSDPGGATPPAASASTRPPLYQPRTPLEQFEDILLESKLLDHRGRDELHRAEVAGRAGLEWDLLREYGVINGAAAGQGVHDEEAAEAIFKEDKGKDKDKEKSKAADENGGEEQEEEENSVSSSSTSSSTTTTSSSESSSEEKCGCSSCEEKRGLEEEQAAEVQRLRECWADLRATVSEIYVLSGDAPGLNLARDDSLLAETRRRAQQLCLRDAHRLFLHLEALVRDWTLDLRARLYKMLDAQAKNPSLAQDFLQDLLGGYDKLCCAAQHLAPALIDLETEHLVRFNLTWEELNKHLYQSVVYMDPLIQKSLPIFISQLTSLYPDKEHESKYKELVRNYLDFDVSMEKVGAAWKSSEALLADYDAKLKKLRAKQQSLKDDWEKFKEQRRRYEKQMMLPQPTNSNGDSDDEDHSAVSGDGSGRPASCSAPAPSEESAMAQQIGESLNHILNGLEDLGLEEIPSEMEHELRMAMNLPLDASVSEGGLSPTRLLSFSEEDLSDFSVSSPPLFGDSAAAAVLQIGGGFFALEAVPASPPSGEGCERERRRQEREREKKTKKKKTET